MACTLIITSNTFKTSAVAGVYLSFAEETSSLQGSLKDVSQFGSKLCTSLSTDEVDCFAAETESCTTLSALSGCAEKLVAEIKQ